MKYDPTKKLTVGVKRTLATLNNTMIELLKKKEFEHIRVSEICEVSLIPKSTFYNYFEDKYDLLNYCFFCWEDAMYLDLSHLYDSPQLIRETIGRMLDKASGYKETFRQILRHNPPDGQFCNLLYRNFSECCYRALSGDEDQLRNGIPIQIAANMNACAIISTFEWVSLQQREVPKEEVTDYILKLLQ